MSIPSRPFFNGMAPILGGLLVFFSAYSEAASVEDTLLKKGILNKDEWTEIKTTQGQAQEDKKEDHATQEDFPVKVEYKRPGFSISTKDGNWETTIKWRFQFRASYPRDGDPRSPSDFSDEDESTFRIRRARIKVGGHGYRPWLKYYFEYDWPSNSLLDWRAMLERFEWLQLKVGQWKIDYNRERVDSSGKQQFVERSIVNREFTIDRQQGVMLYGHLFPGTFVDSRYYVGAFTGMGRGATSNDDDNLMYMARLQWNFLGRDLKWQQSDVEYHSKPAGSIAVAAVTNKSRCTRWSSGGCGNLDGFPDPDAAQAGQFRVNQAVEEFAFKYRGLSIQHEFHWKKIKDKVNDTETDMRGGYAQAGYFPHYLIQAIPKPLEVAFRYAFVDPNTDQSNDIRRELTAAVNWFFSGHNNKLTLDASRLTMQRAGSGDFDDNRARLQWDVTF